MLLLLLGPDGVIWRGEGGAPDAHGGGGARVHRGRGRQLRVRGGGRVAEQRVAVHRRVPGVGDVEAALRPPVVVAGEHIGCLVRAGLTRPRPHDAAIAIATHCQGNVATQLALEDGVIAVGKTETIAITFLDGSSLQAAIIIIRSQTLHFTLRDVYYYSRSPVRPLHT